MDVSEFDYDLPTDLIAQHPPARRASSRLLVLHRQERRWEHRRFHDLLRYLKPGDMLVLNDTRVLPARLVGRRRTGGLVRCLLVEEREPGCWQALLEARGRLHPGEEIDFGEGATGELVGHAEAGGWWLRFASPQSGDLLARIGRAPLPPYIKRPKLNDPFRLEDLRRYQTVFARRPGAIAAPTAGLHFSPGMLHRLSQAGIVQAAITLHVGVGTFQPIRAQRVEEHHMHREWVSVPGETVSTIHSARARGGQVVACGTTVVRALESSVHDGVLAPFTGFTELFITPGYRFQVADALLTNFHLPRSTLLVLVSAFAGREFILKAYAEAVRLRYRFYSYGDAMLIL
jgi:S-adenosylmethionine:tRNA ribosyltransferase-isomerase